MTSRTRSRAMPPSRRRLLLLPAVLAAAAGAAGAETATTTGATESTPASAGTIAVTGTALPALVTETEPCAVLCYAAACLDSGCEPGNFACVCGNPHSLVVKMGLCVGNGCDDQKQFDSGDWIAEVCSAYDKAPGSAALASASLLIVSEISAAAATATDNPVPSTGSIDNGSGTTATATGTSTGTAAAASATKSSAAAASLGGPARGRGGLGLTSIMAGLVGAVAVAVAAAL